MMKKALFVLAGAGAGAGLMYLADPGAGRRRRAYARDAAVHASHVVGDVTDAVSRDAGNRWRGIVARTASRLIGQPVPGDDLLAARVRARVGRLVSHPRAIAVSATSGIVTLKGPIFASQIESLLDGIAAVPGVAGVVNRLDVAVDPATPQGASLIEKFRAFARARKTQVRHLMTAPAQACRRDTNLAEAVRMMWDRDCGALPVVDADQKVIGMITDRDISMAVGTKGRPADAITVGEVTSGTVYSCCTSDDVSAALQTMKERRVRRLPVVDAEGRLAGIVSFNDIVLHPDAATADEIAGAFRSICEHRGPVPVPHAA